MPQVVIHPDVPLNVVILSHGERHLAPSYFERGWLICLKDVRIEADFRFLSAIRLPRDVRRGHVKFMLTHEDHAAFDGKRKETWALFRQRVFDQRMSDYFRFVDQVRSVNEQLHTIASTYFPRYRFQRKRVCWKFEEIPEGQNLHIDNIDGCERQGQLRVFTNLSTGLRKWSMAQHLSVYARRHYASAGLDRFVRQPFAFNNALTEAAFGYSHQSVPDPRHLVDFEPGEVWIVNSAVVAHQVRYGTLLALDLLEFPYEDYEDPSRALPAILADLEAACGRQAAV
ncbi:MAG: hypothetical protein IT548_13035 [Alphaproteobacteria bacterium]|nr:hypothetical protein [Alphaproteobacteria bacterium]